MLNDIKLMKEANALKQKHSSKTLRQIACDVAKEKGVKSDIAQRAVEKKNKGEIAKFIILWRAAPN